MSVNVDVLTLPLFINGKWEESVSGETFDIFNPATGELAARAAKGTMELTARTFKQEWTCCMQV